MKGLTPQEKLTLIRELTEKHKITAYEIGEHTELNTSGVHRILTGDIKNPRHKTLNTILDYIENKLAGIAGPGSEFNNPVNQEVSLDKTIQELIAVEVVKAMQPQLDEFKSYSHAILRALSSLTLDADEVKEVVNKLVKESKKPKK